jgi:hypothetical protein
MLNPHNQREERNMPRVAPLSPDSLPELAELLDNSQTRMGFLPNS